MPDGLYFPSIPRLVHRGTTGGAAVVLPASGALTTLADGSYPAADRYHTSAGAQNGAFLVPDGIHTVTWWLTYTRGGAAGAMLFGVMASNGTETARIPVIDQTLDTGSHAGYAEQAEYPWDIKPPVPSDGNPVVYGPFRVDVEPGWYVWLQAMETGNGASPGSLLVALTAAP